MLSWMPNVVSPGDDAIPQCSVLEEIGWCQMATRSRTVKNAIDSEECGRRRRDKEEEKKDHEAHLPRFKAVTDGESRGSGLADADRIARKRSPITCWGLAKRVVAWVDAQESDDADEHWSTRIECQVRRNAPPSGGAQSFIGEAEELQLFNFVVGRQDERST